MNAGVFTPVVIPVFLPLAYPAKSVGASATVSFLLEYWFYNNGTFEGQTTVNGIGPATDNYIPAWSNQGPAGAALDNVYEVMCTVLSGPALNSGVAAGLWWPMSFASPRKFGQSRSKAVDGVSAWNNSLQFDIRSATTTIILATTTVSINGSIV